MAKIPEHLKTKIPGAVFERETLVKTKQPNPARKIEFEVGDVLQDDFLPQWKTKHWDNECNFSARLVTKDGSVTEHDGKLAYDDGEKIARFYEKDTGDEDGGFEFDVVLNQKPASNVLTWTLQHKDLDFFYQPPLTAEEIAEGATRPENVIGSYAVYHKTKKNNKVGGKEYRTGKAFHIYRPYAEDKKNDRVWCELNITDDVMTVTIPEEWLDNASYPVVVDPTFGYLTAGNSSVNLDNRRIQSSKHTLTEAGDVTKLTASISVTYGSIEFLTRGAIYNDSRVFVAETTERSDTATIAQQWVDYTFASSQSLTAADYWLSLYCNNGSTSWFLYYDTVGSTENSLTIGSSYPTWPTIDADENDQRYSIYATYTASARRRIFIIS